MKRFNRILSLVLAVVMLAGTATTVQGEVPAPDALLEQYNSGIDTLSEESALYTTVPDSFKDRFSNMLSIPYDELGVLEISSMAKAADSNVLRVHLNGNPHEYIKLYDDFHSTYVKQERATAHLHAVLIDRDTNEPIRANVITHEMIKSVDGTIRAYIIFELPDGFDKEKHKLIFFFEYRYDSKRELPDGTYTERAISEPVEADLSQEDVYGNGDANCDGKLNLSDVTMIMKYIAKWEIDGFSRIRADVDGTITIDIIDVSIALKRIAGWQSKYVTTKHNMDRYLVFAEGNIIKM